MTHYWIELATYCLILYFIGCAVGAAFKKWLHANELIVAPVYQPYEAAVPEYKGTTAKAASVEEVAGTTSVIKSSVRNGPAAGPYSPTDPGRDAEQMHSEVARPQGLQKPRGGKPDDLLRIKGVGPKYAKLLNNLGFYHYDQIASWTDDQASWVDGQLGFDGRIDREDWVNQCALLRDGKETEFVRLYGADDNAGTQTKRVDSPAKRTEPAKTSKAVSKTPVSSAARPKGIEKARGGKADDLQRISGIGPKNEKVLHNLGFFHFDQIADWTKEQIDWVDDHLNFNGRIGREEWVRQARLLADGKEDEFRRLYGSGGKKDSKGESQSGSRTRK